MKTKTICFSTLGSYETPKCDTFNISVESVLCASTTGNITDVTEKEYPDF